LSQGIILLIDYGYGETEYYHPERNRGTLTAFYQHQLADPLQHPGLHDITAHVNFTAVIEKAADFGCQLAGYTTQAAFLLDCGLMTFAEQIEQSLSQQAAFRLHQAIKTLTLPTEMGERIKVMALSKQFEKPLIGFNFQDRKRDL
jgi:SAM-dependent MidA family methyltransferase